MARIQVNGTGLFVETRGSGPPILFQHGYTGSHDSWDAVVERLQDRFQCVVMDARGAGDSEHPADGYTMEQYASDVVGVADAVGIDRFTFVGHSMGGGIGMVLGLEVPERLEKLVLVAAVPADGSSIDPAYHEEGLRKRNAHARDEMIRERVAQAARPEVVDEAAVARSVDRSLSVSDGHFEGSWQAMCDLHVRDRLGEIMTPTLVIGGASDSLLPGNLEDYQLLGNATLHVFSRVGHGVPREVPAAFSRVLADFMEHGVVNAATIQARLAEAKATAAR